MADGLRCPADLTLVAVAAGLIGANGDLFRIGESRLLQLHIHRHVNEHRPRPPGSGDVKGFLEDPTGIRRIFQKVAVLDEGFHHAGGVHLLKHVPPQQMGIHLAGNHDQRNGIHLGGGDAADQVGGAGAGSGDADPAFPADPGVTPGGVAGVLLGAD